MTILYSKLAKAYHEMYLTIFDYDKEFETYNKYLKENEANNILELGCGTGELGYRLQEGGYQYEGIDLHQEMLKIALENHPTLNVRQGDMRNFEPIHKYDAILITGRSFTYLTNNEDVFHCLTSVHEALKPGGILIFDNFNAMEIFGRFQPESEHDAIFETRNYKRINHNSPNLKTGWTWNWNADYIITEGDSETKFKDSTVLRAFTVDELLLYLKICGFEINTKHIVNIAIWIVAEKKYPIYDVVKYKYLETKV